MSIYITSLAAISNDNNNIPAKAYSLDNGKLAKALGRMDVAYLGGLHSINCMSEFKDFLSETKPEDAFLYGMSDGDVEHFVAVPVYRQEEMKQKFNDETIPVIARTRSNFCYAEGKSGILFIDIDGISGNPDAEIDKIYQAIPQIKDYPHVIHPSSSSSIIGPDGKQHTSIKGLHLYWAVEDARRIPEYGKIFLIA